MNTFYKPIKPISLLDHQKSAVAWMNSIEAHSGYYGGILADNMGLGKTFSIMGLIGETEEVYRALPQLIIVPLAMVSTWVDTFTAYNFAVYSISSKTGSWVSRSVGAVPVYICHYHSLISKPWLFHRSWFRIVVDEAHNIRNYKSRLFSSLALLDSHFKWYVTATPIINGIKDLIAPLLWLGVIRSSRISLVELEDIYNSVVIREKLMLKRSVLDIPSLAPSMPTFTRVDKKVSMNFMESIVFMYLLEICNFSDRIRGVIMGDCEDIGDIKEVLGLLGDSSMESQEDCEDLEEDMEVSEESFVSISALKGLHFLKLLSIDYRMLPENIIQGAIQWFQERGGILSEGSMHPSKYSEVLEKIDNSKGSTIVFCQFNQEIINIKDFLSSSGILGGDIYVINGAVSEEERASILLEMKDRVSRGHKIVLLLQLKSGACGLNLQYFSSVVFLSLWWNRAIIDQAIGRVVRLGGSGCKSVVSFGGCVGYDLIIREVLRVKEIA